MMAPYAIGHLKMSFLLEELGYRLQNDDRVKLYLTNTLEMEELAQTELPGMASLSEESHLAGKVKKEQPILVIMGNPPYSKSSANKSVFIEHEMDIYKEDVSEEKNIQPLSDDYIKFIRFAHWKIEQDGKGILGLITNNSYLSGLIHRGMRKKLLECFDKIYILNLHGSSRIGEKCPDGSKDENVFDIQQGVSLAIFIKNKNQKGHGKIYYQNIYGHRENKYEYLGNNDVSATKWIQLQPSAPYYFFVEKDFTYQAKYDNFLSIQDIFVRSSSGVKTHRDHFVVSFAKEELKQRLRTFTGNLPDEIIRQTFNLKDTGDFKLKQARDKLKKEDWQKAILPYSYRPFDNRYICYRPELIDRDRYDVMKNFTKDNLGLIADRTTSNNIPFNHVFVSNTFMDVRFLPDYGGAPFQFPLYLYKEKDKSIKRSFASTMMLFEPEAEYGVKKPNLSAEIVEKLSKAYKKTPFPEEIFYYIYAVLYSETYRTKYAEFLKIDFPRVPFTKDYKLFKKMSEYGNSLVNLHLLSANGHSPLQNPIARFQVEGSNRVEKPKYTPSLNPSPLRAQADSPGRKGREKSCPSPLEPTVGAQAGEGWVRGGRVYINKEQYFEGISEEVWNYQIGGYQVCDKWLKDRKERVLSLDDIQTYCRIVTAIQKTLEIQNDIDKIYDETEKTI